MTRATITRRDVMAAGTAVLCLRPAQATEDRATGLPRRLADLERGIGGRLGVAVLDTQSGLRVGHRAGELFPLCSTFKLPLAAAVLARVDAGQEHLDRIVHYSQGDVLNYAPVTKLHVGDGLSVAALCEAAITLSDNTAANLLLARIGGPSGLTRYFRSLGDPISRLDRTEPTLNESLPGDSRDTTTPDAMLDDIHRLVLGDTLKPGSRQQLATWLLANKTSGKRLGAALPAGWRLGDKTGSGERGSTNDAGILWPPDRKPIVVAIYLTETSAASDRLEATIAEVGRAIVAAMR